MGDEVKITVIATGFRDQMPERRARMLDVEAAPVVSVPVMAGTWLREAEPIAAAPAEPPRPRFLSEDDEPAEEPTFFSASAKRESIEDEEEEAELVGAPTRPQFAELAQAYTPLPRDFASDFGNGTRASATADDHSAAPPSPRFTDSSQETERDLDVPAFMRRMQY